MINWPTTLPIPSSEGYGLEAVDSQIRSDMDNGATRIRRRFNQRRDRVAATFDFTDDEMAIFRAFWDDDDGAAGGVAWVTMDVKTGDGGVQSKEVRFIGPWSARLDGPSHWKVTATLEVR